MNRSLLLFKGALLDKKWVEGWSNQIGNKTSLMGLTSTSKNLDVALGYSQCHTKYKSNQQPVLFIYSILNYRGLEGFRLNDKRFSVYPQE